MSLEELYKADEEAEQRQKPGKAPAGGGLQALYESDGATVGQPDEEKPGVFSKVVSAVTEIPKALATGFRSVLPPAVAAGAPTDDALKAAGRSASVIPEPPAGPPPPPAPVRGDKDIDILKAKPPLSVAAGAAGAAPLAASRMAGAVQGERGVPEELAVGAVRGTVQLGASVGTGLKVAGHLTGSEGLKQTGQIVHKYWDETAKTKSLAPSKEAQGDLWDDPSKLVNPKWLASSIGEMTPSLAAVIIPGGGAYKVIQVGGKAIQMTPAVIMRLAKLGASVTGGAVGGFLEGTGTFEEVKRRGGSDDEATKAAAIFGLASAGLNAISLGSLMSRGSVMWRGVKSGVSEAITEWLEEPVEALVLGDDIVDAMKRGLNVAPGALITGGVLGGATGGPRQQKQPTPAAAPVTPDQALKTAIEIARERAAKLKDQPAEGGDGGGPGGPGGPAGPSSAEAEFDEVLKALVKEELAPAVELPTAAAVAVEKTGGPLGRREPAPAAPETPPPPRVTLPPAAGVPAGPVRLFGPSNRPVEAQPAPVEPEPPAPGLKSVQELVEQKTKGLTRPAAPAPQGPQLPTAAAVAVEKTGGPLGRREPAPAAPETPPPPRVTLPPAAGVPAGPAEVLKLSDEDIRVKNTVTEGRVGLAPGTTEAQNNAINDRARALWSRVETGDLLHTEDGTTYRLSKSHRGDVFGTTLDGGIGHPVDWTALVDGGRVEKAGGRRAAPALKDLQDAFAPTGQESRAEQAERLRAADAARTRPREAGDLPVKALTFRNFVEANGKKWPITAKDPDFARLRAEFDDMRKGLYAPQRSTGGMWAVVNRKTGEEVDHMPIGAKAQLEANRLNGVVTLDQWRNAQVPTFQGIPRHPGPVDSFGVPMDFARVWTRQPDGNLKDQFGNVVDRQFRPVAKAPPRPEPVPRMPTADILEKLEAATLEGPKPPAEAPKPAAVQPPPPGKAIIGKNQEIRVPAGSKYQIRYEVVEADDMIPSHNPQTFAKDPRYPEGVQNRPYHSDKSEQAKVIRQGQDFEPLFLVSPQPSSGGTPIVAPDSNVVLSGNSRTMTLMRQIGTDNFGRYREALAGMAPALGIDPQQIAGMRNPILVRRLVGTDTTPEFYRRFAKETNEGFKQALNTQAAAVSQGLAVKPETMDWMANGIDALGENATMRDFLRSGRDREIIRRFINDGVFTERELNRYVDSRTGMLNEDGKRLVERAVMGNAIPDPDLLGQIPPAVAGKIERSLGALAKIKGRGEQWDLGKDVADAVRTIVEVQATKSGNVAALRSQGSLLEEAGPSSRADILADALLRMKPNDFKAAIGRYADEAMRDVRGQETLGFAKPMTPEEAFQAAFGAAAERPARASAEESVPFRGRVEDVAPPPFHAGGRVTESYVQWLQRRARAEAEAFLGDVSQVAAAAGVELPEKVKKYAVKEDMKRAIDKAQQRQPGWFPTDILRTTLVSKDPVREFGRIIDEMKKAGYDLWVDPRTGQEDITNRFAQTDTGYRDVALKFVRTQNDPLVKEVLVMAPNMFAAKFGEGHDLYKERRTIEDVMKGFYTDEEIARSTGPILERENRLYDAAFEADRVLLGGERSISGLSGPAGTEANLSTSGLSAMTSGPRPSIASPSETQKSHSESRMPTPNLRETSRKGPSEVPLTDRSALSTSASDSGLRERGSIGTPPVTPERSTPEELTQRQPAREPEMPEELEVPWSDVAERGGAAGVASAMKGMFKRALGLGETRAAYGPVVKSPEFRRWFGKSKVVDEDGSPKVVHHGTGSPGFETVDPEKFDPGALVGPGFYTTEAREVAGGRIEPREILKYFPTREAAEAAPNRVGFVWSQEPANVEGTGKWVARISSPQVISGYVRKGRGEEFSQETRDAIADEIEQSRHWQQMFTGGYLSRGEAETARRYLKTFRGEGSTEYLTLLTEQPFNLRQEVMDAERNHIGMGGVYPLYLKIENPFYFDQQLSKAEGYRILEAAKRLLPGRSKDLDKAFSDRFGPNITKAEAAQRETELEERGFQIAAQHGFGTVEQQKAAMERYRRAHQEWNRVSVHDARYKAASEEAKAAEAALRDVTPGWGKSIQDPAASAEYAKIRDEISRLGSWKDVPGAPADQVFEILKAQVQAERPFGTSPGAGPAAFQWAQPGAPYPKQKYITTSDILKAAGFDGITHEGGKITGGQRHQVWVAFDPEQVKSAIGNRGTFSPTEKSMVAEESVAYEPTLDHLVGIQGSATDTYDTYGIPLSFRWFYFPAEGEGKTWKAEPLGSIKMDDLRKAGIVSYSIPPESAGPAFWGLDNKKVVQALLDKFGDTGVDPTKDMIFRLGEGEKEGHLRGRNAGNLGGVVSFLEHLAESNIGHAFGSQITAYRVQMLRPPEGKYQTARPGPVVLETSVPFASFRANPPFFSGLAKAIAEKMPERATPEQVLAITKGPGVKPDEVKWTGLDDWLAEQKGPVTKAQVAEFLQQNAVKIEEKLLGETPSEYRAELIQRQGELQQEYDRLAETYNQSRENRNRMTQIRQEMDDLSAEIMEYPESDTKYSRANLVLPGGQNNRELLIQLPQERMPLPDIGEPARAFMGPSGWEVFDQNRNRFGMYAAGSEAEAIAVAKRKGPTAFAAEDHNGIMPLYWRETVKGRNWEGEAFGTTVYIMRHGPTVGEQYEIRGVGVRPALVSTLAEAKQIGRDSLTPYKAKYQGPHWSDTPNVLVSIRFNERVDKDGKRVLFIEEIQSDWHQEGRRKGYGPFKFGTPQEQQAAKDRLETAKRNMANAGREFDARIREISNWPGTPGTAKRPADQPELNELTRKWEAAHDAAASELGAAEAAMRDIVPGWGRSESAGVPPAPFAKTWHELAMKRMLRWAAEHGYDRVAWTTGEQQAERYDLSKQLQSVTAEKLANGKYELDAKDNDGRFHGLGTHSAEELENIVGKDLAEKIVKGEGQPAGQVAIVYPSRAEGALRQYRATGTNEKFIGDFATRAEAEKALAEKEPRRRFTGVDLKVGGEGMKGFYDKILPEWAAKYGKKWGATVGKTELPGAGERTPETSLELKPPRHEATAHSIDVTPEMRKSVLIEGQPLFSPQSPYAASRVRAREGATTADREMAQAAMFDLEQASRAKPETVSGKKTLMPGDAGAGVRTVFQAIKDMANKGFINWAGQTVKTLEDLAVLGQIARDPRYETFRVIYMKGDKVLASEAVTSHLPNSVEEFYESATKPRKLVAEARERSIAEGRNVREVAGEIGERESQRRDLEQVKWQAKINGRMERLGADGFYMMHNHPSGRAEPSGADLKATEWMASKVPGFKGHVVIDSGQYGMIRLDKVTGRATSDLAALPGAGRDELLGGVGKETIQNDRELVKFARAFNVPTSKILLMYRDANGSIRAVQEMPLKLFMREKESADFIRGFNRKVGTDMVFAVLPPGRDIGNTVMKRAAAMVSDGVLREAIIGQETASEALYRAGGRVPSWEEVRMATDTRTVRVQEERAPFGDWERLKPETRKKLVAYGQKILDKGKTDYASWAKEIRERIGEEVGGALPGAWSELMQEAARTQRPPKAATKEGGKPPEPPAEIPKTAKPIEPAPGLTDPQMKLGIHKDIVKVAGELFEAGKIKRDPERLISDDILGAIEDGRLQIETMADVLQRNNMTFADLGTSLFRPAITDAARRLGALGALARRLEALENELKGSAPGDKPGKPGMPPKEREAKIKTVGDILEAARIIDPDTVQLSWWRRADNVRRGMLVTQLATAVRNFTTQVGRLGLDVMDQGLQGSLQRAFGKQVTKHPVDAMRALTEVFSQVDPRHHAKVRDQVDALLEGLPRYSDRLFNNYASDLNTAAKKQGAAGVVDKALTGAEKAVDLLNTVNRFQEYVVRRAVFQAEMAGQLRRLGLSIEQVVKDPSLRKKIPLEAYEKAVKRALEVTFAESPARGSAGDLFIRMVNKMGPAATWMVPFPRFLYNSLKFHAEFSPLGFVKMLTPEEIAKFRAGDMQTLSRAILGSAMLSAAYLIRKMQDDDTKWYEVRLPGMTRTLDTRAYNPFAAYLFVADLAHKIANDRLYGGGLTAEAIKTFLGANVRGGTGLQAVDQLVDGVREIGDAEALKKYLKGAGGHLIAGLLTPLQQFSDMYAEFDPESRVTRNVKEEPFLGPIKQRLPAGLLAQAGVELPEEKASPTSEEPVTRESPGIRQLLGLTFGKEKNDFEKELDRLQIPYREILPSQGDARLDNIIARHMGEQASKAEEFVNSPRFLDMGDINQRLALKKYMQDMRKRAKAKALLDPEYREIQTEVKAGTSKERLQQMADEERAGLR